MYFTVTEEEERVRSKRSVFHARASRTLSYCRAKSNNSIANYLETGRVRITPVLLPSRALRTRGGHQVGHVPRALRGASRYFLIPCTNRPNKRTARGVCPYTRKYARVAAALNPVTAQEPRESYPRKRANRRRTTTGPLRDPQRLFLPSSVAVFPSLFSNSFLWTFPCTPVFSVAALVRCSEIIIASHGRAPATFIRGSAKTVRGERFLF